MYLKVEEETITSAPGLALADDNGFTEEIKVKLLKLSTGKRLSESQFHP
jgi:hypothetical protein